MIMIRPWRKRRPQGRLSACGECHEGLQRIIHDLVTEQQQFRMCVHPVYLEVRIKVTVLLSLSEILPTILFPRNHDVNSTP